jgi:phospholipid/cholesterol/gamma-HCH transport system ATP-binding protein
MALIELDNVTLKRNERTILDKVSLQIAPGIITAIMGSSGSGKSTLLNLMTGRLQPTIGSVKLFSVDLSKHSPPKKRYALWRRVGFLFQSAALFNDLSVIENVRFPIAEHTDLPERLQKIVALMKLESVGLRAASEYLPHQLSGGMQRRVALARAIALDPEIVFYDEPFAGQDPISMGVLVRLIQQFTRDLGITSLVVSHDVGETLAIADRVIFLHQGRIYFHGTAHEFVRCQDPGVVQFVQALADGPVQFHMNNSQALGDQLLCLK